jgi:hypothetical protein
LNIGMAFRASWHAQLAFLLLAASVTTSQAQGRFQVSADGQEVLDASTQLTWRRCPEGQQWTGKACAGKLLRFDYAGAKKRARSAAKSDGKAWHVPTREHLVGLVDKKAPRKPKIDVAAFPTTPSAPFWASRPGTDDDLNAWLVNFGNGKVTGNVGQAKFALRLVRPAT